MPHLPYKIQIASQQRYSCICCGRCCQRFRVLLRPGEIERLEKLAWGDDKPYTGKFYETFAGFPYFKRQPDGRCIFQGDDGRCLMHKRFGFGEKALTCRGYPLNYVSTWPGEVSVLARMDCPAVLRNHGSLLSENRREIERLALELHFGGGFTATQLQGLCRPSIELICDSLRKQLQNPAAETGRLVVEMMLLVQRLERLGATFLNDHKTLEEVLPSMIEKARKDTAELLRPGLSAFSRAMFRQLLNAYCLRDEEMLDTGIQARVNKAWQICKNIFGGGNWRTFGQEHPNFPVREAKIFRKPDKTPPSPEIWETWRRFVSIRLECFQFFGFAYYQQPFFIGLKALLLTYPVALAHARVSAASQGRKELATADVEYAVASVDHCHGRSPRLKFKFSRHSENYFTGERFPALIADLGLQ